ncbi:MAG TPA: DUF86 domain-containing protein [Spirochaetota bacterium]|nr:DUF86 domain-containing protein [Spirochaetota bacterium]
MYDKELVKEILSQILTAISRIERRASIINKPDDFISTDEGIDKLDAICMMLIAIGESLKYLDKLTNGSLLGRYPEIDWKGAKGVRDILSHHYFDLNAEVVFTICKEHIDGIGRVIRKMLIDV